MPLWEPFAEQVFSGGVFFEGIDSLNGICRGQGGVVPSLQTPLRADFHPLPAGLNQLQGGLMGSEC